MTVITIKPMYNPVERTKIPEQPILEPDIIFEPDEDFYNSISMEEVREKLHRVIDKLYANQ